MRYYRITFKVGAPTSVDNHNLGKIVKVTNEKVVTSGNASWLIIKDPIAEIKKAVSEKDYFKTVAYACAVLDYCGKQILVWHSEKTGEALSENVADWSLKKVINMLYSRRILTDRRVRKKMQEIRRLRNSFIHEKYSLKLTSEIVEKVNTSTEDIVSCVGLVKYKYDKSVS